MLVAFSINISRLRRWQQFASHVIVSPRFLPYVSAIPPVGLGLATAGGWAEAWVDKKSRKQSRNLIAAKRHKRRIKLLIGETKGRWTHLNREPREIRELRVEFPGKGFDAN